MGDSGYTACLGSDFDLLQLTAPASAPDSCGVVFARGNFPDDPSSILARGQRAGFGFGFRLSEGLEGQWQQFLQPKQNRRQSSGYLNYRWPITRETLATEDGTPLAETITVWYVAEGTLYQITKVSAYVNDGQSPVTIPYRFGDRVRLGCSCTGCPASKDVTFHQPCEHRASLRHHGRQLVVEDGSTELFMQLFINGMPIKLPPPDKRTDWGGIDIGFSDNIRDVDSSPIIVVHMASLRGPGYTGSFCEPFRASPPKRCEVDQHLGLGTTGECWGRLWSSHLYPGYSGNPFRPDVSVDGPQDALKLDIIARTVENLTSVAAIPVRGNDGDDSAVTLISNLVSHMTVDVQVLL